MVRAGHRGEARLMRSLLRPILAVVLVVGGASAAGAWAFFGLYLLLCDDVSDCTERPVVGIALLALAAVMLPVFFVSAARITGQRRWVAGGLVGLVSTLATGTLVALTPLVSWSIPIALAAGSAVVLLLGRSAGSLRRRPR
jgi:hypothetical protein